MDVTKYKHTERESPISSHSSFDTRLQQQQIQFNDKMLHPFFSLSFDDHYLDNDSPSKILEQVALGLFESSVPDNDFTDKNTDPCFSSRSSTSPMAKALEELGSNQTIKGSPRNQRQRKFKRGRNPKPRSNRRRQKERNGLQPVWNGQHKFL